MSTYSDDNECLQLKKQNLRSMRQETQQKTFKFAKSRKGEINFWAGIPAPSLDRQHKCFR